MERLSLQLQNAVEWRLVMSRGQAERSQMHAMSVLLNTCSGMTNRVHIDDGARWILQGDEQERENRAVGVNTLYWMLAATTSGRAKEIVKQGLGERNGMIAFGRIRERFGKTAGVAKLSDVFQFQWTSPDSLEDKWLRWQKMMRQVNMTSLGDDARETLTIPGLEKAMERTLEKTLASTCSTDPWTVLCAGVHQYLRTTVDSGSQPTPMELVPSCQRVPIVAKMDTRKRDVDSAMRSAAIVERLDISERYADNVKNLLASQVTRTAVRIVLAKAVRAVERQVLLLWTGRSSTT